jgi:hypothetical protein
MMPWVLVATWRNGAFAVGEMGCEHELSGRSVQRLTTDGQGGALAIVDGHTLQGRSSEGVWTTWVTAECALSCCVASDRERWVCSSSRCSRDP